MYLQSRTIGAIHEAVYFMLTNAWKNNISGAISRNQIIDENLLNASADYWTIWTKIFIYLIAINNIFDIRFACILGHAGILGNELAYKLA